MSRWQVKFEPEAEDDLERLGEAATRRIIERLSWLESNFEAMTPLPLGYEWRGHFKFRVGDWRVIYRIDWEDNLIIIEAVDRRDMIYKKR